MGGGPQGQPRLGSRLTMAAATPERRLAVQLLREQRVRKARARDLLRGSAEVSALPARGRGLVTALVLGVVRTSGALDEVLASHLRAGMHLEPKVRDALRLATYELMYHDTPARVAVSQGVELARLASRRAAGLANAVLRRVAAEDVPRVAAARQRIADDSWSDADLALAGGLPCWLVRRMGASLTREALVALVRGLDGASPVYVAGNAVRRDASGTALLLKGHGLAVEPAGLAGLFRVADGGALARSGLVRSCDVVPCDLAAQLVALACEPKPGERVLEVGQGRGTKSILLENAALAAGGPVEIEAVESEAFKVDVAQARMRQAGLADYVRAWSLDGRQLSARDDMLPDGLRGRFDLVFVDAPCSGTGTMRRHPEIPWTLSEGSVSAGGELPQLQLALLTVAASRVRSGGRLVYATCSVLNEEDVAVVDAFLKGDAGRGFTAERMLRTWETPYDCDGHFCVRLVRR